MLAFVKKFQKHGVYLMMAVALSIMTCVSAFATGGDTSATADTVMTALTNGLTTAQGHAFDGISSALPLALGIAGVIIAVTIGYRLFKRMSK